VNAGDFLRSLFVYASALFFSLSLLHDEVAVNVNFAL
jgi:hypothetical protein